MLVYLQIIILFSLSLIIFLPIGESFSLLHLPDIYHEISHVILYNSEKNKNLSSISKAHTDTLNRLTVFYKELIIRKKRERS